jgi:OOP family OmpA-OmpF porin
LRPRRTLCLLGGLLSLAAHGHLSAQPAAAPVPAGRPVAASGPAAPQPGRVVVSGTVPDEATRQAIVARMRELYGADRVVDQLGVAPLVAPPAWNQQVLRLLDPALRQISRGQLSIQGNVVDLKGEVANEAQRQQLAHMASTRLNNPTYTVRNGLRAVGPGQDQLDAALAHRTIEFEPGSARLTPAGQAVLTQLIPLLMQFKGRSFEVIGHTDGVGARSANVALSEARASSVKAFLVGQGLPEAAFSTSGVGPDRPVASNDSADGRARNRRIEFRVGA